MKHKISLFDIADLIAFSAILFISSFHVPNFSLITSILLLPSYILILKYAFKRSYFIKFEPKSLKKKHFFLPLILLTIFCLFFFISEVNYNYIPFLDAICFSIKIILYYILGICVANSKSFYRFYSIPFLVLCITGGGILFAFLSLLGTKGVSITASSIMAQRSVFSLWTDEQINGPSIDMYNYLGICLLPFIFKLFAELKQKTNVNMIFLFTLILSVFLFLVSSYSSLSLLARTPIFCFFGSILIQIFHEIVSSRKAVSRVIFKYGLLFIIPLMIFYLQPDTLEDISRSLNLGIFKRFDNSGLETPRYLVWSIVFTEMWSHPFGGREIILPISDIGIPVNYAHNIWLDIAFDAGILPMFCLGIFHLIHWPYLWDLISNPKYNDSLSSFLRCNLVAVISAFIGTPVLQANLHYFSISCFLLGLIIGIMQEKYYCKNE
ncbi:MULTISPECIES: O-antigen ligase family protein [unclassified Nostoc]|uniref:O-antigen ligase family protein n=1 Tax=unclassified Nostoc TaxID=2593658 RepID=UPI001DAF5AA6|nr:O-antigen ligase family protein [Nostoc sp. JL23]MBN3879167.1 O-antigen ligase family protein [Nostoc sp. JL23]